MAVGVADGYAWPHTLRLPARPPKLVYLDLNHWVTLAKSSAGHKEGERHRDVLAACIDAVDARTATFPVADAIYYEVSKIGPLRWRRDLATVIERVSQFATVTSRVVVATHEIEALLDFVVGPNPSPINSMDYLDWGVMRAFGFDGSLRVRERESDEDVTDKARLAYPDGPEAFDELISQAHLTLNRKVLEGPLTPEEEADLRARGWNPLAAHEVAVRRAAEEQAQAARFDEDPEWRGDRIRDVVAAHEVVTELMNLLSEGLAARAVDLTDVFTDLAATRRAFNAMPSFDVAVSVKVAYHRNPHHAWKANDIHDIDAMALTVPYCDVVVTDKQVATQLSQTGVAKRCGTVVLSRLEELPPLLAPSA